MLASALLRYAEHHVAWLGRKKLAFIPLSRTNASPPDVIPPDWVEQITQRIFYNKDPVTGADRSVRAYFHTVSSGLADLDAVVLPPQTIAGQDIAPDALEPTMGNQLRSQGFDGAAIVMLGGPGGGSTGSYWSRFSMSDNLGNWVGELSHLTALCDLPDLFDFTDKYPDQNMVGFDQEAGYMATHFCGRTKRGLQWLNPATTPVQQSGTADYTLHAVSLTQPPPTGRVAAVQVGQQVPYLMVEARLRADQFDANIPSEGVILYLVQTTDQLLNAQNEIPPLNLLTKKALTVGQSYLTTQGVSVGVNSSVPGGGFSVTVSVPPPPVLGKPTRDMSYLVPLLL